MIKNGILHGEEIEIDVGNADVGTWLLETLKNRPDFVGQIDAFTGEENTFGQMLDASVRCALWLRKKGLKPEDAVCSISDNCLSAYIPIFATWYNRAIFSSWSIGYSSDEPMLLMKPKFIFSKEKEIETILKVIKENNLDTKVITYSKIEGTYLLDDILQESTNEEVNNFICTQATSADEDCLIILTSGTSSEKPKYVLHSYKSVYSGLKLLYSECQEQESVSMIYKPMSWTYAMKKMLVNTLCYTRRIVVSEYSSSCDDAFHNIEKYKVSHVVFGISMLHQIYKKKDAITHDISSLKIIQIGTIKIPKEILETLMNLKKDLTIYQTFGNTESFYQTFNAEMNEFNLNSCGHISRNAQVKILDTKTGAILGPNEIGELCIKNPSIMKCYFKDQESTDEVLDSEGWFHTKDLAYYDKKGYGFILGRLKTLTTSSGNIVPLWEVERAVQVNTEVGEVASIAIETSKCGPKLYTFVIVAPKSEITEEVLTEMVKELSSIDIPFVIKIVDKIPLTSRGKYKISEIKKMAENLENQNIDSYNGLEK